MATSSRVCSRRCRSIWRRHTANAINSAKAARAPRNHGDCHQSGAMVNETTAGSRAPYARAVPGQGLEPVGSGMKIAVAGFSQRAVHPIGIHRHKTVTIQAGRTPEESRRGEADHQRLSSPLHRGVVIRQIRGAESRCGHSYLRGGHHRSCMRAKMRQPSAGADPDAAIRIRQKRPAVAVVP